MKEKSNVPAPAAGTEAVGSNEPNIKELSTDYGPMLKQAEKIADDFSNPTDGILWPVQRNELRNSAVRELKIAEDRGYSIAKEAYGKAFEDEITAAIAAERALSDRRVAGIMRRVEQVYEEYQVDEALGSAAGYEFLSAIREEVAAARSAGEGNNITS